MSKKKTGAKGGSVAAFAGADADQETLQKLEEAARLRAGANSGEPPDEVLQRNFVSLEVAQLEINEALKVVQAKRAAFGVARKVAKTDTGSQAWVDSLVAAVKLKHAAAKGGAGEIVTEHRQMGRILRIMDVPLGTQFGLFAVPADEEKVVPGTTAAMDAELSGQAAWRNNEPIDNNPWQPGTQNYVDWAMGHNNAMEAAARGMGRDAGQGGPALA